jgi:hypothetical protein
MRSAGISVVLISVAALGGSMACGRIGPTASDAASSSRLASPMPLLSSCSAVGPTRRYGASATYDAARKVTVMFGGGAATAPKTLNETWLFDGHCWQQAHPMTNPAPRLGAAMAYDPIVGLTLLIGGRSRPPVQPDYPQDAWTWDGTTWTRVANAPSLDFPFAEYDQARRVVVVFGWGPANVPETWTWDGTTWARKASQQSPAAAAQAAMCFDVGSQKVILYGGWSSSVAGGVSNSTWLWDGSTWSQPKPLHNPGPRFEHILICGRQTVLYGGMIDQRATVATDTWAWDGSDWQRVASTHVPDDCCGVAVYDGSRYIMFEAGRDGIPIWLWSGSDWVQ